MANRNLFKSLVGKLIPQTDSVNDERAPAYAFSPEQALAQYSATGCLNTTFYASAEQQLQTVLALCEKVPPAFIARTAVYGREQGAMKDLPALLCGVLSCKDVDLLKRVFPRVIDSGKMLRNYVQIVRSGTCGRKSLGTRPKQLVREWIEGRSETALFNASVGNEPSLADVIKMVHPKPASAAREAIYGYLIGKPVEESALPEVVRQFEAYKRTREGLPPDVPFQMLTALDLGKEQWKEIARNAGWQVTRMNLNTFARHGVFEDEGLVSLVADRLRDPARVREARVFPYQLLMAYYAAGQDVPEPIREALQDALEVSIEGVPSLGCKIVVCPDVSGSMRSAVTGWRKGSTTSVRCVDVAALGAAVLTRKNLGTLVLPFENSVVRLDLNPRDSVMTTGARLASVGGGGTNCSAPLEWMNRKGTRADLVIFFSDNESWIDAGGGRGTATLREWQAFKRRNPSAKMVCVDLQPNLTTQARESEDVLNVGGFSDRVFEVVKEFVDGRLNPDHWVGKINEVEF